MHRQVTFYLDRARAAARARTIGVATDVKAVVDGLHETLHTESGPTFAVDLQEGLRFRGEAQDLADMIGNLLDNAGNRHATGWPFAAGTKPAGRRPPLSWPRSTTTYWPRSGAYTQKRRSSGKRLDKSRPGSGPRPPLSVPSSRALRGLLELADGLRATLRLPSA